MALLYRLVCVVCMGLAVLLFAVTCQWELLTLTSVCLVAAMACAGRLEP